MSNNHILKWSELSKLGMMIYLYSSEILCYSYTHLVSYQKYPRRIFLQMLICASSYSWFSFSQTSCPRYLQSSPKPWQGAKFHNPTPKNQHQKFAFMQVFYRKIKARNSFDMCILITCHSDLLVTAVLSKRNPMNPWKICQTANVKLEPAMHTRAYISH